MPTLWAKLGLDGSAFTKGLATAKRQAASWSGGLGGTMKGAIAGAFGAAAIKSVIDYGGEINDLSARTGISTDALQEMKYAAEQSGSSLDAVVNGFTKMQVAMNAALGGDTKKMEAFAKFGVTMDDLKSKSPADLFKQISGRVQELGTSADVTVAMLEVMGKGGAELLAPMRDGFAETMDQARMLGLVLSAETIAALDEAGDSVSTLASSMTSVLAPAIAGSIRLLATLWQSLKHTIGGAATYYGALAGGATDAEAIKQGREFQAQVVAESLAADENRKKNAERLRRPIVQAIQSVIGKKAVGKDKLIESSFDSDAVTKIGGLMGGESQSGKTIQLLERVTVATEQTADNTAQEVEA